MKINYLLILFLIKQNPIIEKIVKLLKIIKIVKFAIFLISLLNVDVGNKKLFKLHLKQ